MLAGGIFLVTADMIVMPALVISLVYHRDTSLNKRNIYQSFLQSTTPQQWEQYIQKLLMMVLLIFI